MNHQTLPAKSNRRFISSVSSLWNFPKTSGFCCQALAHITSKNHFSWRLWVIRIHARRAFSWYGTMQGWFLLRAWPHPTQRIKFIYWIHCQSTFIIPTWITCIPKVIGTPELEKGIHMCQYHRDKRYPWMRTFNLWHAFLVGTRPNFCLPWRYIKFE